MVQDVPQKYLDAVRRLMEDTSIEMDIKLDCLDPACRWYGISLQQLFKASGYNPDQGGRVFANLDEPE